MENKLGRLLGKGEVVHHKDEDKTNDDPDNLEVMSNPRHSSLHRDKAEIVELTCPCGNKFLMKDYLAAKAIRWSKSKVLHCSKSCGGRTARKLQMLS